MLGYMVFTSDLIGIKSQLKVHWSVTAAWLALNFDVLMHIR